MNHSNGNLIRSLNVFQAGLAYLDYRMKVQQTTLSLPTTIYVLLVTLDDESTFGHP